MKMDERHSGSFVQVRGPLQIAGDPGKTYVMSQGDRIYILRLLLTKYRRAHLRMFKARKLGMGRSLRRRRPCRGPFKTFKYPHRRCDAYCRMRSRRTLNMCARNCVWRTLRYSQLTYGNCWRRACTAKHISVPCKIFFLR